jgi:urease accessory protein
MTLATPDTNQRLQRVEGRGVLSVKRAGGKTRIDCLFQEGAAKIRFPRPTGDALEAVLVNTAGGLTGGDAIAWQASAGEGCTLTLTTQASEKVYKSTSGTARADIRLTAAQGASVAWLPQDTILFDRCAVERTIEADLDPAANLLILEPVVFGRRAMGEQVRTCRFHDFWRICVAGKLVHGEAFRIDGDAKAALSNRASGNGAGAMATILLVGPAASGRIGKVRECLQGRDDIVAGAGFWEIGETGKLLARIVAKDGYCLRNALVPLVRLLNGNAGLPKIWST